MRPKLPEKEKDTHYDYRLEIVYAPDVPISLDGKPFLVHCNAAHYLGQPKVRTIGVQVYYYNFATVKFTEPVADMTTQKDTFFVECLDYPGVRMQYDLSDIGKRRVPAMQRKYNVGAHNIEYFWWYLRVSPYNGPHTWGPGHDIELMEYVGGEGRGWDLTEARQLAGRLREEVIPALARVPSQSEYQKVFIVALSISPEEAEKLYKTREEVGLP